MKKLIGIAILLLMVTIGYIAYQRYWGPATLFSEKHKIVYLPTGVAGKDKVLALLQTDSIIKNAAHFDWLAQKMGYWEQIKPGRYKIVRGMSATEIVQLLRSGNQDPARLVINKLRVPADLIKVLDKALEMDSTGIAAWFNNPQNLAMLGLNETNLMAYIVPDTYEVIWTWGPEKVLKKLKEDHSRFWDRKDRRKLAEKSGFSPLQVHTIASIVEEETNLEEDRPKVASVYLNRLKKGMPLQADPTVRFAMKDFKSNRVLFSHLKTPSPYNTYLNTGIPPGPICTASPQSIDAVLKAPQTDYIFFVANADLRGGSTFTTNLADHNRAAKVYQDSLTAWLKRKAIREKAKQDSLEKVAASQAK